MKNNFYDKFIIGGAQLGMAYGNKKKKLYLNQDEIKKIFILGKKNKINKIDTSQNYFNSEKNIGLLKKNLAKKIFIITKFNLQNFKNKRITLYNFLKKKIIHSTKKLKVNKIDVLLIHRVQDLKKYKKDLINALKQLKKNGYINEAGISIYTPTELTYSLKYSFLKNIQIPFNIADQRWLDKKLLKKIKEKKIKIYVRSIFLRGLLINNKNNFKNLKIFAKKIDLKLKDYLVKFKRNNKLELCLAYVKSFNWISYFIIGFNSLREFREILRFFKTNKLKKKEVELVSKEMKALKINKNILMPNLWKN